MILKILITFICQHLILFSVLSIMAIALKIKSFDCVMRKSKHLNGARLLLTSQTIHFTQQFVVIIETVTLSINVSKVQQSLAQFLCGITFLEAGA